MNSTNTLPPMVSATLGRPVTDAEIDELRTEALAGQRDLEMARLCSLALEGDETARAECQRVIDDARAMDTGDDNDPYAA